MPATRRSSNRDAVPPEPSSDNMIQTVVRELALLRKSMETKFTECTSRVGTMKEEVLAKLNHNDKAVADLQSSFADVTLSVDRNKRAIQVVRAEAERMEHQFPVECAKLSAKPWPQTLRRGREFAQDG